MGPSGTHEEQRHGDAALWPHLSAPPSPSAEQNQQRRWAAMGAGSRSCMGTSSFACCFIESFCQSLPDQRRIGIIKAAVTLASNYRQQHQSDVQD